MATVNAQEYLEQNSKRFEVYRQMYDQQKFQLELCADVAEDTREIAEEALKMLVEREKSSGKPDHPLIREVLITSERRTPRAHRKYLHPRNTAMWYLRASAL